MAKALTVKALELIKPDKVRREVPDAGLQGLYFVVQPSGAKSWAVRYRHQGVSRKLTIGPYPRFGLGDARKLGAAALRAASEGRDPAGEKKTEQAASERAYPPTRDLVETAFDEFLARHVRVKNRKSSATESARIVEREIKGAWAGRRIQDISRRDVNVLLDSIVDRGSPFQANRVLSLLRKAFNWFIERDIVQATPVANISPPAKEVSRDRILTQDEIRALWQASEAVGWPFGPLARLLLLTGQRRDEVAGAAWEEFDLGDREPTWTIPKERAKNGITHLVALSPAAVTVLRSIPRVRDADGHARLVFTTTGDTTVSGFSRGKRHIDREMLNFARGAATKRAADPALVALAAWRFHDLRRTAASGMASLGIGPHVVEKVLNHTSGTIQGVAAVYNRFDYAAERRQALIVWANYLEAVIGEAEMPYLVRGAPA